MATDADKPSIIDRAIGPAVQRAVAAEMEQQRPAIVSELVGRYVLNGAQTTLYKQRMVAKTLDETRPDYAFYDALRRCKAAGYRLGGLFCRRIENVFAAWVFGGGLEVKLAESQDIPDDAREYTNARLAELVKALLDSGSADDESDRDEQSTSFLQQVYADTLGLGDQYIIVNPDGSLSVPSPDTVEVERDELDYRRVTAVTVTTKLDKVTIIDRYEADRRVITYQRRTGDAVQETREEYANLIGRIPVVHVAHGRAQNETNGHSIHEDLLELYNQYDDLVYKQLDGAKLLGNPIPTFTGLADPAAAMGSNEPEELDAYADKDGHVVSREVIQLDQNPVVALGEGGDFKMVAPPTGFTADTKEALKSLFLLLLDHTGIPEFIWGNELSSARASSGTQMEEWVHETEARQRSAGGWVVRLCKLVLMMWALVDPRIVVGRLQATWAPLVKDDEEIKLKQIITADDRGWLTDATGLGLLHLVDDPEAEAQAARAELDAQREALFPDGDTLGFQSRLQGDE